MFTKPCPICCAPVTKQYKSVLDKTATCGGRQCIHDYQHGNDTDRFMRCVDKLSRTGCWNWSGSEHGSGYGRFAQSSGWRTAHRVSYEMFVGPIPKLDAYHGVCVLHRCDNRKCVNPDHLFLGTHQDNIDDMVMKGRGADKRGTSNGRSKLSDDEVRAIRLAKSNGEHIRAIAEKYGMSVTQIIRIISCENWGHVI